MSTTNDVLHVVVNGEESTFDSNSIDGIYVLGKGGDDRIAIHASVSQWTQIFGDGGNDTISGGSGNDYIRGGQGNDRIGGGAGHDLIIGGSRQRQYRRWPGQRCDRRW